MPALVLSFNPTISDLLRPPSSSTQMPEGTPNRHAETTKPTGWQGIRSIFPSEFQDALVNNCPPRPGVLQTARAFREDPALSSTASKKRIEDIDKQMKALKGERERLADEHNMRTAVTEACAAICAPARRLPRDILHEIAHYALATHPSPSKNHAPMNLSHVSSAWRSVVLHAPHLWADLYLRIKTVDHRSIIRHAQTINAWFRRAGVLPINLSLYVDCKIASGTDMAYNFSLLLNTLAPWSSRVARLGIGGQHWINLMTQFADIEWELLNLHTLEILGQRASEGELINDDMAKLEPLAPRITLFRTSGKKFTTLIANQEITSYFSAFSFLPWQKFTSVVLKEQLATQHELHKLLVSCPHIHFASMRWMEGGSDLNTQLAPIPVQKLERLSLEIKPWNLDALPGFFSAFTFLSLTHLEINVEEVLIGDDAPFGAISSFPALSFLRLFPVFPTPYIIKFLWNTPKLRTFILDYSGSATDLNKLFDSMVVDDAQRNFLPLLEEFAVQICDSGVLLDFLTLSRFICSRTQDLPSSYTSFKKLSLMGDFSLLADLHEEVARMSGVTGPAVEIIAIPSFDMYDSLEGVEFPDSFFAVSDANDRYEDLVDHESWLT